MKIGTLINIDSQAPNMLVKEWLAGQGYSKVVPEYTFGDSRIDFYMENRFLPCHVEPEIASRAAILHDLHAYKTGSYDDHYDGRNE